MLNWHVGWCLLTAALTCWLYVELTCWLCVASTCWLCVELTCWLYIGSTCWLCIESTCWLTLSWHVGCMLSRNVGWRLLTYALTCWLVYWIDLLIFELFYSMQLLWTNCHIWLWKKTRKKTIFITYSKLVQNLHSAVAVGWNVKHSII